MIINQINCLAIMGGLNSVTLVLKAATSTYQIMDIQLSASTNGITVTSTLASGPYYEASPKMITSTKNFYLFGKVYEMSTSYLYYTSGSYSGFVMNFIDNCVFSSTVNQLSESYGTWTLPDILPIEFPANQQTSTSFILPLDQLIATNLIAASNQPQPLWCSLKCTIDNQTSLDSAYYYTVGTPSIILDAPVAKSSNCSSFSTNPIYYIKDSRTTAVQLLNQDSFNLDIVIVTNDASQVGRYTQNIIYMASSIIFSSYSFLLFINDNHCENNTIVPPPDAIYLYSIGDAALLIYFDEFEVSEQIICYFYIENTYLNSTFYSKYVTDSSTIYNYLKIYNANTSDPGGDFIIIQNASWGNQWATRQVTIRVNVSCSQDVVTIKALSSIPYYWDLSEGSTRNVLTYNISHTLPTCYVKIMTFSDSQTTAIDPIFSFSTSDLGEESVIMNLTWATTDPQKAFLTYNINIFSYVYYQNYERNNTFSLNTVVRISDCSQFSFTLTPQVYYYTLSVNSQTFPFNVTVSNATQGSPFCNISYSATFNSNGSLIPSNDSDVVLNSDLGSLLVQSTNLSQHVSYSLTYNLIGVVQYSGFTQSGVETLNMIDPCITSQLYNTIYNNTYLNRTLNNYSVFQGFESNITLGSMTIGYNSSLPNECGGADVQIYMFNDPSVPMDSSIFTYEYFWKYVTVNTSDTSKIGIYHIVIDFNLYSYPQVKGQEHVYINIFCNITSFQVVQTSSLYQYLVGSAPLSIFGAIFTQYPACNYPITYSAAQSNGKSLADLSNLIDYDHLNNTFTVSSSDPQQQTYNITVVGVLTDQYDYQFKTEYSFLLQIYSTDSPSTINITQAHNVTVNSTQNATSVNSTSSSSSSATQNTEMDNSTVIELDYSTLNQSKQAFVRQNATFVVPQNIDLIRQSKTLTAIISEVTLTGGVKIKFSEKISVPDYCLYYDNSILNVSINSPNSTIQHWNVSSCGEYEIYLQLNFTNTLQISSTLIKDQVQVIFLANGYFRTAKDNTSIPYQYTMTSAIPPQLENSSIFDVQFFQLQPNYL